MNKSFTFSFIFLFLVIAACDNAQNEGATANVVSSQDANTNIQQNTNQQTTSRAKVLPGDLNALLQNSQILEYQARYKIESGVSNHRFSSEIIKYQQDGKIRTDTLSNSRESRTYKDNDIFYQCSNSGAWTCYSIDLEDTQQESRRLDATKYNATALSDREIAGAIAKCFEIDGGARIIYCFSQEGVPLYTLTNSTNSFNEMIAISYSVNIPQGAFTLPAPPQVAQQVFFDNSTLNQNRTNDDEDGLRGTDTG